MEIDWGRIKQGRDSVKGLFPRILKIPIIPDAKEKVYELIPDNGTILDVGAHDRKLGTYLHKRSKSLTYKSLDTDKKLQHDFYSLDDITEEFDVIVLFEVIEHLDPEDAIELLIRLYQLLKEGGSLVVSTPNIFHPTIFWRDCTHKTGFRYNELAGIMSSVGCRNLEVYRISKVTLKEKLLFTFYRPLLSLLNMDFVGRILVIGKKIDLHS
jgi:2-polyprenyl-3-methyl-5-hydroxy-6-metoxy-1,4-benzoquinol methylase